jgi:hypothetical protein
MYVGEFTLFVKKHWKITGLTPVFLRLMVEYLQWSDWLIDDTFQELVGKDYADIKMTAWVDRLENKGIQFPDGK